MPNINKILILALLLFTPKLYAEGTEPTAAAAAPSPTAEQSQLKSWYFGFGVGGASPNYSANSSIDTYVNGVKSVASSVLPMYFDIYFLWPVHPKLLLGVSDSGFVHTFGFDVPTKNPYGTKSSSVTVSQLGAMAEYFFSSEDATGLFLRADVGISDASTADDSDRKNLSAGNGLNAAIGYNIAAGNRGALLNFQLGYQAAYLGSGTITATHLSAGVSF